MTQDPVYVEVTGTSCPDLKVLPVVFGSLDFRTVLDAVLVRLESFSHCVYKI